MGSIAVSLTGTNTGHSTAWLEYTESNINVTNNSSTMTFTMYLQSDGNGTSWRGQSRTLYFTVAGTQYGYAVTFDTRQAHTETLFTHTQTFTHASDGSFSTPVSISFDTGLSGVSGMYLSETWVPFTTIARKSTATLNPSSINIGSSLGITISRADSSYTHTVYAVFGSTQYPIASKTSSTSLSWTLPTGMANIIPNAVYGVGNIVVETYSGSTLIGSNVYSFTAYVPDTSAYQPTISSFTALRVDGTVPSDWGKYVQGKSKVTLAVAASGVAGSTIKAYTITGPSLSATTATVTSGYLQDAGTLTYTAKVIDTRNRTATATLGITVVPYTAPNIISASAVRCTADGTETDEGTCVKLHFNSNADTISGSNTITRTYMYRKVAEGEEWSTAAAIANDTDVLLSGPFSADYMYDFQLTVADVFSSVSTIVTVGTSYSLLDFLRGGKGLAIGKAATIENLFDILMDVLITGKFSVDGQITLPAINVGAGKAYIYSEEDGGLYLRTRDAVDSTNYKYYKITNAGLDLLGNALKAGASSVSSLIASNVSTSVMSDYIIAQGTSGNWRYWKWASGFAICIHSPINNGNFTATAWGAVFDCDSTIPVFSDYPFNFAAVPFTFACRTSADTNEHHNNYTWIAAAGGNTTTPPKFDLVRATAATIGHPYLMMVAIGRWK